MPHHTPMFPLDQPAPARLETPKFILRKLEAYMAEPDYDAWVSSIEHLQGVFGPDSTWPSTEMTLEENRIDLAWHQREHETHSSFAFTVMTPAEDRVLGCVYMSPPRKQGFDCEVFYWVRADEVDNGLDEELGNAVRDWLKNEWPFKACVYPGRDVSWNDYNALENATHW